MKHEFKLLLKVILLFRYRFYIYLLTVLEKSKILAGFIYPIFWKFLKLYFEIQTFG